MFGGVLSLLVAFRCRTVLTPPSPSLAGLEIIDAPQLDTLQMMSLSVVYNHITVRNTGLISVSFPALDSFNRTDQSYMEVRTHTWLVVCLFVCLCVLRVVCVCMCVRVFYFDSEFSIFFFFFFFFPFACCLEFEHSFPVFRAD